MTAAVLPVPEQRSGFLTISWHRIGARLLMIVMTLAALAPLKPERLRAEDIPPPFGLDWGESTERMQKMLEKANAKVVSKATANGRDKWTVSGLKQEHLKQTIFYFRKGGLEEVELQYENTAWGVAEYNKFLSHLRLRIEQRYGAGQLIARGREALEDQITQTIVGYHWSRGPSQIEIIYYSAEKPPQDVFRTVSLHYKAVY